MNAPAYKILIAYDGTLYNGWQVQPNGPSIQETLETTFQVFLREPVKVIGSGRTDTGVHAHGQAAHFHCEAPITSYAFLRSANALLPSDIRVLQIEPAPLNFHARYSAVGKIYHYHLWLDPVMSPFKRLYAYHVPYKISLSALKEAAAEFVGTHDFKAFANSAHEGVAARDSIRTIFRLDIVEQPGGIRLEFEGDGFLYKMVRNIVGTLLHIASGKSAPSEIGAIFASQDRRLAAQAAPAHGLFLEKVLY